MALKDTALLFTFFTLSLDLPLKRAAAFKEA
jgi:hypothetical protein